MFEGGLGNIMSKVPKVPPPLTSNSSDADKAIHAEETNAPKRNTFQEAFDGYRGVSGGMCEQCCSSSANILCRHSMI